MSRQTCDGPLVSQVEEGGGGLGAWRGGGWVGMGVGVGEAGFTGAADGERGFVVCVGVRLISHNLDETLFKFIFFFSFFLFHRLDTSTRGSHACGRSQNPSSDNPHLHPLFCHSFQGGAAQLAQTSCPLPHPPATRLNPLHIECALRPPIHTHTQTDTHVVPPVSVAEREASFFVFEVLLFF